jgi:hypothetical protein
MSALLNETFINDWCGAAWKQVNTKVRLEKTHKHKKKYLLNDWRENNPLYLLKERKNIRTKYGRQNEMEYNVEGDPKKHEVLFTV